MIFVQNILPYLLVGLFSGQRRTHCNAQKIKIKPLKCNLLTCKQVTWETTIWHLYSASECERIVSDQREAKTFCYFAKSHHILGKYQRRSFKIKWLSILSRGWWREIVQFAFKKKKSKVRKTVCLYVRALAVSSVRMKNYWEKPLSTKSPSEETVWVLFVPHPKTLHPPSAPAAAPAQHPAAFWGSPLAPLFAPAPPPPGLSAPLMLRPRGLPLSLAPRVCSPGSPSSRSSPNPSAAGPFLRICSPPPARNRRRLHEI